MSLRNMFGGATGLRRGLSALAIFAVIDDVLRF